MQPAHHLDLDQATENLVLLPAPYLLRMMKLLLALETLMTMALLLALVLLALAILAGSSKVPFLELRLQL